MADIKAKRGDLVVIERVRSYHTTTERKESREFAVMLVSNITRDGQVKAVKDVRWGDDAYAEPVARMLGLESMHLVPQTAVDVPSALATVRAHTYPNSTTPRDYESLDAVREALRPHRRA